MPSRTIARICSSLNLLRFIGPPRNGGPHSWRGGLQGAGQFDSHSIGMRCPFGEGLGFQSRRILSKSRTKQRFEFRKRNDCRFIVSQIGRYVQLLLGPIEVVRIVAHDTSIVEVCDNSGAVDARLCRIPVRLPCVARECAGSIAASVQSSDRSAVVPSVVGAVLRLSFPTSIRGRCDPEVGAGAQS